MYGVCAGLWPKKKNKRFAVLIATLFFLTGSSLLADQKKAQPNMGKVISDGAYVYKQADFDAEVLTQLPEGKTYPISSKVVGAFYKIKVAEGVYGFIADTDVKTTNAASEKKEKEKEKKQAEKGKTKKHKPLEWEKFHGFQIAQIAYREDTMGIRPTENILFFGAKLSGPDVVMDGVYTDANFLFSYGAPKYYENATGNSASGYIVLLDFLFETASQESRDTLVYYGFGPMLKYSKIDAAVTKANQTQSYDMTDINIGAVFNLGICQRFESFALRGEAKYYWEKMQYLGFAFAFQLPF